MKHQVRNTPYLCRLPSLEDISNPTPAHLAGQAARAEALARGASAEEAQNAAARAWEETFLSAARAQAAQPAAASSAPSAPRGAAPAARYRNVRVRKPGPRGWAPKPFAVLLWEASSAQWVQAPGPAHETREGAEAARLEAPSDVPACILDVQAWRAEWCPRLAPPNPTW